MRRYLACAVVALLVALVGPRLFGPRSHAAGAPFVYLPPDGFQEKNADTFSKGRSTPSVVGRHGASGASDTGAAVAAGDGMKVWIFEDSADRLDAPSTPAALREALTRRLVLEDGPGAVHAVLHHSAKEMSVEEADLAKLAEEMPRAFEDACTWVHRRHELRTRNDGARVGLIEGDCTRDVDFAALGVALPAQKTRARKLQLMFPDDEGTSIVTASYPIDQASRWEPLFEATIAKARGVATRVPGPPWVTTLAWGAAGAVFAWFALALFASRRAASRRAAAPAPGPSAADPS